MRRLLFKCVTGSHNYGLNDENSDVDMKAFYLPTFEDMFYKTNFEASSVSETEDIEIKDVRSLVGLLTKSNATYIEMLFSQRYSTDPETDKYFWKLHSMRHDIARMNLPRLRSCCAGMALNNMKEADRIVHYKDLNNPKTPGKNLLKAYRILDLFERFYKTGFSDFGKALYYKAEERQLLFDIKNEVIPYDEALSLIKAKDKIVMDLKEEIEESHSKEFFNEVKAEIESVLEAATREFVRKELV